MILLSFYYVFATEKLLFSMLLPLNIWTSTINKKIILYPCWSIRMLLTPPRDPCHESWIALICIYRFRYFEKLESYADESSKWEFSKQLSLTFWVWKTPSPSNLKPPPFSKGREELQGFPTERKFLKIDSIDIETHFSTCWNPLLPALLNFHHST